MVDDEIKLEVEEACLEIKLGAEEACVELKLDIQESCVPTDSLVTPAERFR